MTFGPLIKNLVQSAMQTLGPDLAPACDYTVVANPTYDPVTGTVTEGGTVVENVPMVLARFSINEVDAEVIVTTDYKALIAALDLPGVTPGINDHLTATNGKEYNVQRIMGVPGESLHILHVREV